MKEVMIITNSEAGLYSFRRELIGALIASNYKVSIVTPKDAMNSYFGDAGCEMRYMKLNRTSTNPFHDIHILMKYFQLIRKRKPVVVLTYTIKPNIYGGLAAGLLNTNYIATITGLGTAVEYKGILQNITIFLYKLGLNKSSTVFFQNSFNQKFMLDKKIKIKDSRLIPGSGVNLDYFSYLQYPIEGKIKFFFISRVIKEKGIDQYLEAATYIKGKYDFVEFHILGGCSSDYKDLIQGMHDKGIINYHGIVEDVRAYYAVSSCTVHPSYYPEGMSNVLLESLASGRPIITTSRPGCGEIVDDGYNGYLVEEQNSKDLIKKIEKFIGLDIESRKKMGVYGRNKVEKEYSREIVVNEYLERIKSLDNSDDSESIVEGK